MKALSLFYATNRRHEGKDRFRPEGYGAKFSDDGSENLRFGKLTLQADERKINEFLNDPVGDGVGNGNDLADYLTSRASSAKIQAYRERINPEFADIHQPNKQLGSIAMFNELRGYMRKHTDVLVYLHGYNVSWAGAVGAALSLQEMLNHSQNRDPSQVVRVVLFTWPSDGMGLPFVSYKSDRTDARGSGYAIGRGFLKLADYLVMLRDRSKGGEQLCDQDIHLLCHSMGNYVLQNALERMAEFTPRSVLPRIFEHVFLCAADVDDNVLEPSQEMSSLHEVARSVSVYYNWGDAALHVSDYTKGNPERLGTSGAARPAVLHNKVCQIDCSPIVHGLVEHSYYLTGNVNADIKLSIDGVPHDDPKRRRKKVGMVDGVWTMT